MGSFDITGEIERVSPSAITPGLPIDVIVAYRAHYPGRNFGWVTKFGAILDSFKDEDTAMHWGEEGGRTGARLRLGTMPNRAISGYVYLQARVADPFGKWVQLDSISTTINLPEELPTITPKPPPTEPPKEPPPVTPPTKPPAEPPPDEKTAWEKFLDFIMRKPPQDIPDPPPKPPPEDVPPTPEPLPKEVIKLPKLEDWQKWAIGIGVVVVLAIILLIVLGKK